MTAVRPIVVIAMLIVAVLAGCAGPATPTPTAAPALLPPAEGTTQYPLTLATPNGASVLPERPQRVAVIGFSPNVDALEALAVTPVYTLTDEPWEWRSPEWLAGIETVDSATRRDPIPFEAIAAARPDLIIAFNAVTERADHDRLSRIAPVLDNEQVVAGDRIDWRETQRLIGRALDLTAAADQVVAGAERAITATAAAHPRFAGKTMTIAYDYTDGLQYYTVTGGTAEGIVTRLGFAPNPLAANFTAEAVVSDERIDLLDADVLVVLYTDEAARQRREGTPLFQALRPVADGRYVAVITDADAGASASWVLRRGASALSVPWAVDAIADEWLSGVTLG